MMTGLVTLGPQSGTAAQLPVAIDYPAALALHQMALNYRNICWPRSERPAALCARSAPQDVAGHPLENRSAH